MSRMRHDAGSFQISEPNIKQKLINMEKYDKEFLNYMKDKYKITPAKAKNGREVEIITFAVAWNVWKQAKKTCFHPHH